VEDSHRYANPDASAQPKEKGDAGEEIAADYFKDRGFRIRAVKFKAAAGEVDLVVEKGDLLVFVEVRYRRSAFFGSPDETVTPKKQRRIVLTALEYASRHGLLDRRVLRFDVLSIVRTRNGPRIEYFEDAFDVKMAGRGFYSLL
jgi:putative endonuclease